MDQSFFFVDDLENILESELAIKQSIDIGYLDETVFSEGIFLDNLKQKFKNALMIIQNTIVKFIQTILRYDKIIEEKYKTMTPEQRQFKVKCVTYKEATLENMTKLSLDIAEDFVDLLSNIDDNVYTQKLNAIKEKSDQIINAKKDKLIVNSDIMYKNFKSCKEWAEINKRESSKTIDQLKKEIDKIGEENIKKYGKGFSYIITIFRTLSHFQNKLYLQLARDTMVVISQAIKSNNTKSQEE